MLSSCSQFSARRIGWAGRAERCMLTSVWSHMPSLPFHPCSFPFSLAYSFFHGPFQGDRRPAKVCFPKSHCVIALEFWSVLGLWLLLPWWPATLQPCNVSCMFTSTGERHLTSWFPVQQDSELAWKVSVTSLSASVSVLQRSGASGCPSSQAPVFNCISLHISHRL